MGEGARGHRVGLCWNYMLVPFSDVGRAYNDALLAQLCAIEGRSERLRTLDDNIERLWAIMTGGADTESCWAIVDACLFGEPETLCPRCVRDPIDPESSYGFCASCSESHAKGLKASRQERWAPEGWRQKLKRAPTGAAEMT